MVYPCSVNTWRKGSQWDYNPWLSLPKSTFSPQNHNRSEFVYVVYTGTHTNKYLGNKSYLICVSKLFIILKALFQNTLWTFLLLTFPPLLPDIYITSIYFSALTVVIPFQLFTLTSFTYCSVQFFILISPSPQKMENDISHRNNIISWELLKEELV